MIFIKDNDSISKMVEAGKRLAAIFRSLQQKVVPGQTTLVLNDWIDSQLAIYNLVSATKGYRGYKHASCISVNDEIVHGIPKSSRVVQEGDLVKVDVCASWQGYCADMTRPFFVGALAESPRVKKIINVAKEALDAGIQRAYPGNRLTDISAAIQNVIDKSKYGIVREFAGHGIGKDMHEDPDILNYGKPGKGPLLKVGMAFALEPMITEKSSQIYIAADGWTACTADCSLAMHIEDTVVISNEGPLVTTRDE
jgi:methionyl aminopeptidase